MAIKSFKDLVVWQKSFLLCQKVYELTSRLPSTERFGLTSHLQRCAVSIPSNIAEGQQRHNTKEYRQFIGIARGSAGELETQLLLIQKIYKLDVTKTLSTLTEIQKMLHTLAKKLEPNH